MNGFSTIHKTSIAGLLAFVLGQGVNARDIPAKELPDIGAKIVHYAQKSHAKNTFIMGVANELHEILEGRETDIEKAKKIKSIVNKKIKEYQSLKFAEKKHIHEVFQGIVEVAYGAAETLLKNPPKTKQLQDTTATKVEAGLKPKMQPSPPLIGKKEISPESATLEKLASVWTEWLDAETKTQELEVKVRQQIALCVEMLNQRLRQTRDRQTKDKLEKDISNIQILTDQLDLHCKTMVRNENVLKQSEFPELATFDEHLTEIAQKLELWKQDPRQNNLYELEKSIRQGAEQVNHGESAKRQHAYDLLLDKHRLTILQIDETSISIYGHIAAIYELHIKQALQDIQYIRELNNLDARKIEEAKSKKESLEDQQKLIQEVVKAHFRSLEKSGEKSFKIAAPVMDFNREKLENIIKKSETDRKEWKRIVDELAASINGPSADFDRATAQMRNNSLNSLLMEYFPEREEFIASIEHLYDSTQGYVLGTSEKQSLLEEINREKASYRAQKNTEFDPIFDALVTRIESIVSEETVQEVAVGAGLFVALIGIITVLRKIRKRKTSRAPLRFAITPLPIVLPSENSVNASRVHNKQTDYINVKRKAAEEIFLTRKETLSTEEAAIVVDYLKALEESSSTDLDISMLAHDILKNEPPRGFDTLAKILGGEAQAVSRIRFYQMTVSVFDASRSATTEPATGSNHG